MHLTVWVGQLPEVAAVAFPIEKAPVTHPDTFQLIFKEIVDDGCIAFGPHPAVCEYPKVVQFIDGLSHFFDDSWLIERFN